MPNTADGGWQRELEEFTQRNAGRRTRMEVDDPEFGAQVQEHDMVLRGVSYDAREGRLEIMLGEQGAVAHLTHTIDRPLQVQLARRRDGADDALRIGHGTGQTVLTIL